MQDVKNEHFQTPKVSGKTFKVDKENFEFLQRLQKDAGRDPLTEEQRQLMLTPDGYKSCMVRKSYQID